ncbi:hypothetical protein T439DRAFT_381887 [Meredithblackwellia eburnea MCA 4105]
MEPRLSPLVEQKTEEGTKFFLGKSFIASNFIFVPVSYQSFVTEDKEGFKVIRCPLNRGKQSLLGIYGADCCDNRPFRLYSPADDIRAHFQEHVRLTYEFPDSYGVATPLIKCIQAALDATVQSESQSNLDEASSSNLDELRLKRANEVLSALEHISLKSIINGIPIPIFSKVCFEDISDNDGEYLCKVDDGTKKEICVPAVFQLHWDPIEKSLAFYCPFAKMNFQANHVFYCKEGHTVPRAANQFALTHLETHWRQIAKRRAMLTYEEWLLASLVESSLKVTLLLKERYKFHFDHHSILRAGLAQSQIDEFKRLFANEKATFTANWAKRAIWKRPVQQVHPSSQLTKSGQTGGHSTSNQLEIGHFSSAGRHRNRLRIKAAEEAADNDAANLSDWELE